MLAAGEKGQLDCPRERSRILPGLSHDYFSYLPQQWNQLPRLLLFPQYLVMKAFKPTEKLNAVYHNMHISIIQILQMLTFFHVCLIIYLSLGFPRGSDSKESACNAGDWNSIPGLGRSAGEGNGYPFQYSCLENSMDKGAWQATVHRVAKSQTQLSD